MSLNSSADRALAIRTVRALDVRTRPPEVAIRPVEQRRTLGPAEWVFVLAIITSTAGALVSITL